MESKIKRTLLHLIVVIANMCLSPFVSEGQKPSIISERIVVAARPSPDSVTLRWAPINVNVWQWGNRQGYRVERYTLARDGRLLGRPEKTVLEISLRHLPETHWETQVQRDKFAGIAAQALFGEQFEIDLKESDIFTIVNKVRENEQRFLFALFSADMSAPVARLSGLMYTDKQVKKGEKYLYRVVINSMDSLRGSIYTGPDDAYSLPRPQNLKGDYKDRLVSLRWDKSRTGYYTAYIVERSKDGKHFQVISDSPIVTVSATETEEARYGYAVDSLNDISAIPHYRVRGLTPFGEQGPPSGIISVKGLPSVNQVPYISSADNKDNMSVLIRWDFPESDNHAIKGFTVERSSQPKEKFKALTEKLIPADVRMFEDHHPLPVNYYRVAAYGLDHATYYSPVYFAQLVDSLPPSAPVGVEAQVDDQGFVRLSWKPNPEPDIYGYRIYKAYHGSEELAQITEGPIANASFTDHVDLNTLNETAFYSVMALDINQNHSELSKPLQVALPDKVRPLPPVFLPVQSTTRGVSLSWLPGGSKDIVRYKLYRKGPGTSAWEQLHIKDALSDSVYSFVDESAAPGHVNHYTVVAVDDVGLESVPAYPVAGSNIAATLRPAITWKKPRINRELGEITLLWNYHENVESFRIFRAVDDYPPVLFQTVSGKQNHCTHRMIPGQHYRYRIMGVFEDGKKTFLSDEIDYRY